MTRRAEFLFLSLLLAWGSLGAGCHSLHSSDLANPAAVTIQNHSRSEIQTTVVQVFSEHGFSGSIFPSGDMVFEKPGTERDPLAPDAALRARPEIIDLPEGAHLVRCAVVQVRGTDNSFFEEEHLLPKRRMGPFKSILNEIAVDLTHP